LIRTIQFWVGFLVGILVAGSSVYAAMRFLKIEVELAMLVLVAFLAGVLVLLYRVRPASAERATV
jgi:hypothetical protein